MSFLVVPPKLKDLGLDPSALVLQGQCRDFMYTTRPTSTRVVQLHVDDTCTFSRTNYFGQDYIIKVSPFSFASASKHSRCTTCFKDPSHVGLQASLLLVEGLALYKKTARRIKKATELIQLCEIYLTVRSFLENVFSNIDFNLSASLDYVLASLKKLKNAFVSILENLTFLLKEKLTTYLAAHYLYTSFSFQRVKHMFSTRLILEKWVCSKGADFNSKNVTLEVKAPSATFEKKLSALLKYPKYVNFYTLVNTELRDYKYYATMNSAKNRAFLMTFTYYLLFAFDTTAKMDQCIWNHTAIEVPFFAYKSLSRMKLSPINSSHMVHTYGTSRKYSSPLPKTTKELAVSFWQPTEKKHVFRELKACIKAAEKLS